MPPKKPKTFVIDGIAHHLLEDETCLAGWCSGRTGTPFPASHACGGLVHADLVDVDDGKATFEVEYRCEVCKIEGRAHHKNAPDGKTPALLAKLPDPPPHSPKKPKRG